MADTADPGMRVMLATDDSASARTAEEWVARLRYAVQPIIEVVCVAGRGLARLGWGMQTYREPVRLAVEGLRQSELYAAERIANEVGERLQGAGLTVHTWARQGDCCEELLTMAGVDRPDLVVVGPRGRSGLAAAILGSVTHGLIAHAECPVLVARAPLTTEGQLPEHVLLVVDGTPSAAATVGWLARAGWLAGGRVTVLGLLGDRAGLLYDEPDLIDEVARTVRADATETLEQLAQPFARGDMALDFALRGGHPLQASLDAVAEFGVDLVAVARPLRDQGRDPIAEKIARHSAVSVLLVPQP
ncbi:MAG: universal stress protein [Chloroflexota bacterium]